MHAQPGQASESPKNSLAQSSKKLASVLENMDILHLMRLQTNSQFQNIKYLDHIKRNKCRKIDFLPKELHNVQRDTENVCSEASWKATSFPVPERHNLDTAFLLSHWRTLGMRLSWKTWVLFFLKQYMNSNRAWDWSTLNLPIFCWSLSIGRRLNFALITNTGTIPGKLGLGLALVWVLIA